MNRQELDRILYKSYHIKSAIWDCKIKTKIYMNCSAQFSMNVNIVDISQSNPVLFILIN